jgi:RNA polymerase sigma factor (sigma-70 family)
VGRGEPADDLYQVAVIGLIKAVDRFDVGRGVAFAAFAIPTIVGELKRHFRDRTWSIRVPRRGARVSRSASFSCRWSRAAAAMVAATMSSAASVSSSRIDARISRGPACRRQSLRE